MPAEFPDCNFDGASCCRKRMRGSSDTVLLTLHQHDATRPSANIESGGIQKYPTRWCRRQCPSIKYRKSVVFEFPKKPNTTSNLLHMDLQAGKMGCGRRAVEGAGSTRWAILSARVRVSSYSGEWMEVTSHILLPLLCALSCKSEYLSFIE